MKSKDNPHIMLDIETLGNKKDAAITSIGAVLFDCKGSILRDNSFYQRVDWDDALKYGSVKGSTLKWWMKQSKEAIGEIIKDGISLRKTLQMFSKWYPKDGIVWSNGSVFDIPIMENGFDQVGVRVPWHYRNVRDVRTLVDLTCHHIDPVKYRGEMVAHNALDDSIYQADYVSDMLQFAIARLA